MFETFHLKAAHPHGTISEEKQAQLSEEKQAELWDFQKRNKRNSLSEEKQAESFGSSENISKRSKHPYH